MTDAARPARVTQRLPAQSLPDLLDRPPRAALAIATPDGPVCLPAVVGRDGSAVLVGVDRAALPDGPLPDRGTLLVDDGAYWFQLRAIVRRGSLTGLDGPDGPDGDDGSRRWWRFDSRSEVAWDYATLHEEPEP